MMKNMVVITVLSLMPVLAVSTVHAAGNGIAAGQSSGTIQISLVKTESVRVNGIDDVAIQVEPIALAKGYVQQDICIFSSSTNYGISIESRNGSKGLYQLSDGNGHINYKVSWNDGHGFVTLDADGKSFSNADIYSCDNKNNASLRIDIKPQDLTLVRDGKYFDDLVLLFEPT